LPRAHSKGSGRARAARPSRRAGGSAAPGRHVRFLERSEALAQSARDAGHEPYAALLVVGREVMLEATNTARRDGPMAHAETNLLDEARRRIAHATLARATLYCSTEPCMLCAGHIVRTPIRHVVYGHAGDPAVGGRAILTSAAPVIRVEGPLLDRRSKRRTTHHA
jgi:tRNA(Arg) A34 adenosine deaminase TadA